MYFASKQFHPRRSIWRGSNTTQPGHLDDTGMFKSAGWTVACSKQAKSVGAPRLMLLLASCRTKKEVGEGFVASGNCSTLTK